METKERTETEIKTYLWDIAGVDGLQAMKSIVGEAIDRIAPFRSLESQLGGEHCSILRLCENNFRISCCGDNAPIAQVLNTLSTQHVWIKKFNWLGSLILPEAALSQLLLIAISKPPHRLENLPLHCAAPARINGISVLIWRHPIAGKPALELHAAQKDLPQLQAKLQPL